MKLKNMKLSSRLLLSFGLVVILMTIIILIEIITIDNLISRKDRLVNADAINEGTQLTRSWTLDYYITNADEASTSIDEQYNTIKALIDNGIRINEDQIDKDALKQMNNYLDEYYNTFLEYKKTVETNNNYSRSMSMASSKVVMSIDNLNARQKQSIGIIKAKSNNMNENTDKDQLIFDMISEYDEGQSADSISKNMLNIVIAEQIRIYRGVESYNAELYTELNKLKENCKQLSDNYERQQDKDMVEDILGFTDDYIELYESYKLSLSKQAEHQVVLRDLALEITDRAGTLADEQESKMKTDMVRAIIVSIVLGIIGISLAVFVSLLLTKRLNNNLKNSIDKLSSSSRLIAETSKHLSASSTQLSSSSAMQASAIEETSATMEETSSMVKQNTDNTQKANGISEDAKNTAQHSSEQIGMMVESMDDLTKSSEEISKIIKVIDDIAFQTNMLALNAAVEAARAGEAGLSFAVVANEVRNLAQKSAAAARDTKEIIDNNIELSHNSSSISDKVAIALKDIIDKTRNVNEIIEEITTASTEQERGISQVTLAISEIENSVQKNAQVADESAVSAKELMDQYKGLNLVIDELERLVNGEKNGASHKPNVENSGNPKKEKDSKGKRKINSKNILARIPFIANKK